MSYRIDWIRSNWPDWPDWPQSGLFLAGDEPSDWSDQIGLTGYPLFFLNKTKNVKLIHRIIMNHPLNLMTDPSGYPMNHMINLTDNLIGLKSAYLTDGSSDIWIDQIWIAPLVRTQYNELFSLVVKNHYIKIYKFDITIFICFNIINFLQIL